MPTNPVPAPSSSTRKSPEGRQLRKESRRLASSREDVQVLSPKLSSVRDGSRRTTMIPFVMVNLRNIVGIALRPDLSHILALAAAHICSRASSSAIHDRGEEMMDVRYRVKPLGPAKSGTAGLSPFPPENDGADRLR